MVFSSDGCNHAIVIHEGTKHYTQFSFSSNHARGPYQRSQFINFTGFTASWHLIYSGSFASTKAHCAGVLIEKKQKQLRNHLLFSLSGIIELIIERGRASTSYGMRSVSHFLVCQGAIRVQKFTVIFALQQRFPVDRIWEGKKERKGKVRHP